MDEPYEITRTGTVVCRMCSCEAQVSARHQKSTGPLKQGYFREEYIVTVRCPNPSCENFTGRGESELKIGASLGGDLVTCPECGKGMEGDLDYDEIWHCPKCGDTYGLDDDWYLERMPTEEDIGCQQYHAWAENQGPPMTEDE